MKLSQHHLLHFVLLLLLTGLFFSCKSKTEADTIVPVAEKVLPVPKAREIIHNALLHSSNHFWQIYYDMSEASDTTREESERVLLLARLDSMVLIGKKRYETTLNVLKGVANPDSSIPYKEYAMRIMEWFDKFYTEKYPAFNRLGRSRNNSEIRSAFDTVYNFVELVSADYKLFEEASDSIRSKYNLPKTWHVIINESDIPIDIDDKILSDTSSR
jgi:hypothetical protein